MLPRHHQFIRFLAVLITGISLVYISGRAQIRTDITQEGLSQLTEGTKEVISGITPERPVMVHAFISDEVPREFVTTRTRLINLLNEMEASGGEGLSVRIVAPEVHSPEAEEAMENYGIMPRQLADRSAGRIEGMDVFMGLAFVSGPREEIIPFMDRGLSVEYEVSRALRITTQEKKKVVGILRTDAPIMGNFDIQSRRQTPAWQIVGELKKQYEVRSLNPKAPIPEDVDVLFVPQLASCAQDELDTVRAFIDAGRPALITVDPMPLFNIRLAPTEEKPNPQGQGGGMFGQGGGPPGAPKGDYKGLLRDIGVEWEDTKILYDTHKPNPVFRDAPPQIVFISDRENGAQPFAQGDQPITSGLSQVVTMYGGELKPASGYQDKFTKLLFTSRTAGFNDYEDMVQRHPLFGVQGPMPPRTENPVTGAEHVVAALIKQDGDAAAEEGPKPRNVAVIADLDLFGDLFFNMHQRGGDIDGDGLDDVRFDNIPFLLNLVDTLAGDDRFIELRKRRAAFRRLTRVDQLTETSRANRQSSMEEANKKAEDELDVAKKALEAAVEQVRAREDLDDTTKQVMLKSAEEAENRRLQTKQEKIERGKAKAVTKTETEHRRSIDEIQNQIRLWSVLLPPIPALFLGVVIFGRKRRRESETIPTSRRRTGAPPKKSAGPTKGKKKKKKKPKAAAEPEPEPEPEPEDEPEPQDEPEDEPEPPDEDEKGDEA